MDIDGLARLSNISWVGSYSCYREAFAEVIGSTPSKPPAPSIDVAYGHDSRAIANRLLLIAKDHGRSLTIMQLLKLIFFAHGWTLALLDRPLSKNKAQAWRHGPVFPHVYRALPGSGSEEIRDLINDKKTGLPFSSRFSPEEEDIMQTVVEGYGHEHAFILSKITHEEDSPWSTTFKERGPYSDIPDGTIKNYFNGQARKWNR